MNDALFDNTEDLERRVRSADPESSWDAARIKPADSHELETVVYNLVAVYGPATDEELFFWYQRNGGTRTAQRLRTARAALSSPKGIGQRPSIREHASMGVTQTGHKARRWVIA